MHQGLNFPDLPCPKPGGDWRQLGERKWRPKVFKTQPPLGAGKGREGVGGGVAVFGHGQTL